MNQGMSVRKELRKRNFYEIQTCSGCGGLDKLVNGLCLSCRCRVASLKKYHVEKQTIRLAS